MTFKNPYKREFRIKANRYVNYRIALVGEIAICVLSNLVQNNIVSYHELS